MHWTMVPVKLKVPSWLKVKFKVFGPKGQLQEPVIPLPGPPVREQVT